MDAGTDALEVLLGRVIPVRLGIIGVVNRFVKKKATFICVSVRCFFGVIATIQHRPSCQRQTTTVKKMCHLNRIIKYYLICTKTFRGKFPKILNKWS